MVKALATKNVVAVLAAIALTIGVSFAFVQPAKADTVSDLQSQVQALLAQIQALQGSSSTTVTSSSAGCYTFTQNLKQGSSGGQVMWVQQFLNNHGFTVATTGAGSPGNETSYFGAATKAAVIAFQNAYASTILVPNGLTAGNGNWFTSTQGQANAICAGSSGSTGSGTPGTTTTGGGITITAGTQPANSLAPQLANRVPFTTFTITNNSGAAVTINGIDVQRTGLAADAAFAGVELIDQNGLQIGTSRTFNSNHQAEVGTPWTLAAGASMTYTVAGNMSASESLYAGQVASLAVTGVDTSVPVSGSLPITGASQTINSSLTIGTASAYVSSYDPGTYRSEPIGTTGLIFSGVRVTAGSAEPEKLYSITWNQTGSIGATDLANLVTMVNGTSYPVTVDSTGKYYTATFPGGILIPEGNTIDAYIQGDITGSDASGRTIEFDIYRQSDIYLVGQTYGYGITPTAASAGAYSSNSTHSSVLTNTTPFFEGAIVNVTAGTLSTVGNASSVSSQNIAINVPNQPLGGFSTDFTGEPVSVQTLVFHVASSTAGFPITSVTLVDSNGNTVAGPVDENMTTGTVTFNSSITFPVGPMTYTLEGTVASTNAGGTSTPNGLTFQISTTPSSSSDWQNAQGETSGANVQLTGGLFTMNTMTVEGPNLVIAASPNPATQTIVAGQQAFTFANITLDASQSGEDVRLSSLPIYVTTQGSNNLDAQDLSSCQLMNGNTALNSQTIGGSTGWTDSAGGAYANFVFQNALTISKGTIVTLSVVCNLASNPTGGATSYAVGVNGSGALQPSPVGVGSGITLTSVNGDLTVEQNTSGVMSLGTASMVASLNQQAYSVAAGGSTGITLGTFTLQPTTAVNLSQIGLKLNSSTASNADVSSVYITNSSGTVVGTANVQFSTQAVGGYYYATSSISNLALLANTATTFYIKGNIASIGLGQGGKSGDIVKVNLADAYGSASFGAVNSGTYNQANPGVGIFRSFPTFAYSTTGGTLTSGTNNLLSLTVTANQSGNVALNKLTFSLATTTASIVQSNLSFTGPNGSVSSSTPIINAAGNLITVYFDNSSNTGDAEVTAGNSKTYNLTVSTVSGISGNTSGSIAVALKGDQQLAAGMYSTSTLATSKIIWSPESTSTLSQLLTGGVTDWTNGYGTGGCFTTYGVGQDCPANVLSF